MGLKLSTNLPLCFIGDLHGRLDTARKITSAYPQHYYVFVGDMVHPKRWFNKSTHSTFTTLGFVKSLCDNGQAAALLGNNEYSILANLLKPVGDIRKKELRNSMLELQKMPFQNRMKWLRWLQDLPHFVEINDHLVFHAYPSDALELAVYGPGGEHWFKSHGGHVQSSKLHIFGHYGHPYISDSVKCIDATNFGGVGVYISDPQHFLIFH